MYAHARAVRPLRGAIGICYHGGEVTVRVVSCRAPLTLLLPTYKCCVPACHDYALLSQLFLQLLNPFCVV